MNTFKNKYAVIFIGLILLLLLSASGIQDRLTGNWTYQEVPQLTSSITDIKFIDSLTGFLTSYTYVYKTTNGGYNWSLNHTATGYTTRLQFINSNTGFLAASNKIYKTTNKGDNWLEFPIPYQFGLNDLYALNEDTVWAVLDENLDGGVFRTTNGGINWMQQGAWGASNPNRIYMFNRNLGFITDNASPTAWLMRTTNSGLNWSNVPGGPFTDIIFFDTLLGYKCYGTLKKTIDGGLSWTILPIPSVPSPGISSLDGFSFINRDTMWGGGGDILIGNKFRGILYNSTNGGQTVRYQIPDTSINTHSFNFIQFLNAKTGWVYTYNRGLHTILGGDTSFIINAVNNNQTYIFPEDYVLYQNYPNPFNPFTTIKFGIKRTSEITLEVFDIRGHRINAIVNSNRLSAGVYEYGFDGSGLPSGVYFYRLAINNKKSISKKMILVK